ncbi:MAG: VapC toxin family PIN domain ribonuclease [Acidobacteria bacterium]|nr:VapC toxin family PIN domain ribonuclease [Acidobacteriota bacterium]
MMLPDVNLLVYAVDETSPFHARARRWWDETLSSAVAVGLCYPSLLGFVRLTTSRRMFDAPLGVADALERVQVGSISRTPRCWLLRLVTGRSSRTFFDLLESAPT